MHHNQSQIYKVIRNIVFNFLFLSRKLKVAPELEVGEAVGQVRSDSFTDKNISSLYLHCVYDPVERNNMQLIRSLCTPRGVANPTWLVLPFPISPPVSEMA